MDHPNSHPDAHPDIEDSLRAGAGAARSAAAAATGVHLTDVALARAAEGRAAWSEAELRHLGACAECAEILAAARHEAVASGAAVRPPAAGAWWRALQALAALGAVAAAVALVQRGAANDALPVGSAGGPSELRARGGSERASGATISFLLVDAAGHEQPALPDADVARGRFLAFRFADPERRAHHVVVVARDAAGALHWYSPEAPGRAPDAIGASDGGARRLPFDVDFFDGRHAMGPVDVYAAVDGDAAALAAALATGRPAPAAGLFTIRLNLSGGGQ